MRPFNTNTTPINIKSQSKLEAKTLLHKMTLQEKIGQLFMPMIRLDNLTTSETEIEELIKKYHIGGIMFYKGEAEMQVRLYNYAAKLSLTPLFISIDGETGLAMRLKNTIRFPQALTIGAITDNQLVEEYGKIMAYQCRRLGININFAPVLDINSNPNNPVIGARAFGADKENIIAKSIAYSKGLEKAGILSVAKHFPGHGDTYLDSHKSLPTINKNIDELMAQELCPFKAYIRAGLNGIMIAHLNIPEIDKEVNSCSSLSEEIIKGLLRNKLKFKGLIFTDALVMGAVDSHNHSGLKAFNAGNDIILLPRNIKEDFEDIEEAVTHHTIDIKDLDEHCLRILEYKCAMGLSHKEVRLDGLMEDLNDAEVKNLQERLYEASITKAKEGNINIPLKNDVSLISLGADENLTFVSLGDSKVENREFKKYIDKRFVNHYFYNSSSINLPNDLLKNNSLSLCIEIFSNKDKYVEILRELILIHKSIAIIFYIDCYKMERYKEILKNKDLYIICAYEDAYLAQKYAQRSLFEKDKFKGKLSVNINWL